MGRRVSKRGRLGVAAAVVALNVAVPLAGRDAGYLPKVGPCPLRFAPAPPAVVPALPPLDMGDKPDANADNASQAQTAAASAAQFGPRFGGLPAELLFPSSWWPNVLPDSENQKPDTASADETTAASAPAAASDLLSISPQMLVDYFKPGQSDTNAPASGVTAAVRFLPPGAGSSGSTATYSSP